MGGWGGVQYKAMYPIKALQRCEIIIIILMSYKIKVQLQLGNINFTKKNKSLKPSQ